MKTRKVNTDSSLPARLSLTVEPPRSNAPGAGESGGDANAFLIAAAPDLLEACKTAIDYVDFGRPVWVELREAIAKAEGKRGVAV